MLFDEGSPFLSEAMRDLVQKFKNDVWGWQGPELMTRVWKRTGLVDALPVDVFYPFRWFGNLNAFFDRPASPELELLASPRHRVGFNASTTAVHMYNRHTKTLVWRSDSVAARLIVRVCNVPAADVTKHFGKNGEEKRKKKEIRAGGGS